MRLKNLPSDEELRRPVRTQWRLFLEFPQATIPSSMCRSQLSPCFVPTPKLNILVAGCCRFSCLPTRA